MAKYDSFSHPSHVDQSFHADTELNQPYIKVKEEISRLTPSHNDITLIATNSEVLISLAL